MCHIMYILRPSALEHNFKYNSHPEKLCTTKIHNYPTIVIIVFISLNAHWNTMCKDWENLPKIT